MLSQYSGAFHSSYQLQQCRQISESNHICPWLARLAYNVGLELLSGLVLFHSFQYVLMGNRHVFRGGRVVRWY